MVGRFGQTTTKAGRVTAQLGSLEANQLHMLRVTALASDGSVLWEAPLVALQPEATQSHGRSGLLIVLGVLLAVFLYFRWRA